MLMSLDFQYWSEVFILITVVVSIIASIRTTTEARSVNSLPLSSEKTDQASSDYDEKVASEENQ